MKHRCPVPACETQLSAERFMCGLHWAHVPPSLRDEVREAWDMLVGKGGRRAGNIDRYKLVRLRAVAAVVMSLEFRREREHA